MTSKIIELTRKECNLIAKTRGIKEPQNMSTKVYQIPLVDMIVTIK